MSRTNLFAQCFSPVDIHDSFVATPCFPLWHKWMGEHPNATRLFLRIYHPEQDNREESFLVPVGDPVAGSESETALYLPMWMIDTNKYTGSGEETIVDVIDGSSLPKATRIVLRPVDSALHEVDVVSLFEKYFSRMGVLQEGKLYLIPLEELGGFQTSVFVEKLEPANEVYLDGDEVPLEFERAVDYVEPPPPAARPPTPIPSFPPMLIPDPHDSMIAPSLLRSDLPRGINRHAATASGFVPFSGRGRTLGEK